MLINEESPYIKKTDTFLFCFKPKPELQCCCISIKLGSIVFSIIALIVGVVNTIQFTQVSNNLIIYTSIYSAILLLLVLAGNFFIISCTQNRRADYAYDGYMIFVFHFIINLMGSILLIIFLFIYVHTPINEVGYLSLYYLIVLAIEVYSLFIFYSFARHVALGNWNAVEGDFVQNDNNLKTDLNIVTSNQNLNVKTIQGNFKLKYS